MTSVALDSHFDLSCHQSPCIYKSCAELSIINKFSSHDLIRTCFPGMNVLGLAVRMFPPPKAVSSDLRLTDGLTVLARIEIVTILEHYQPSYNASHTMKSSDPVLLADGTLRCGMYPAGKVNIS